jgi:glucose/arabinose dehydrogenase
MSTTRAFVLTAVLSFTACGGEAPPPPPPGDAAIALRHVIDVGPGALRLARDPESAATYLLMSNGDILRVDSLTVPSASLVPVFTAAETGVPRPQGMAFGPDGTLFLVGNEARGDDTVATVRRGVRVGGTQERVWSTVARTVPYPRSHAFDHLFNGIVVHEGFLYLNSGARTDHGEVQASAGRFPGLRETTLTAAILRIPADGDDIVLYNDARLEAAGYVYARGVRNAFDLAVSPRGELFATDNAGDRDDSDELNWIREGGHYGFPWRMGTNDTPQQFPGYDPAADRLISHLYPAWTLGTFYDDPGFPPRPATPFVDPVTNLGPDANSLRNESGQVQKATGAIGTFTAHRSPLGLVFDVERVLPGVFKGAGFVLSWTAGNPSGGEGSGPFLDESEDLLHLGLSRAGDNYQTTATRLLCGLANPIDAEIVQGRIYVLEHGDPGSIWEVTLPDRMPTGSCLRAR